MEVTRRYWTTVGLAALLSLWALFLETPLPLVGAVLVCAWLVARQYRFVRAAGAAVDGLTVDQRLERTRVTTDDTTMGTLTATVADGAGCSVRVRTEPPTAATGTGAACSLDPGGARAEATLRITWPIAGGFTLPQPTVTLTDAAGLFRQTVRRGPTPSVTVEPQVPRGLHIGAGGERITARFGEYDAGQTETGLTPAEIRKYVAGDSTRRIDWNATARLNEPHVREFDAETDRETLLFVDHRGAMGAGRAGETKLDFARQVALAVVENAQDAGDPLGWYGVGDEGLTDAVRSSTDAAQYRTISRRLRGLDPTGEPPDEEGGSDQLGPAAARHLADRLGGATEFDSRLGPFFAATESYVRRVADDPLFEAVQLGLNRAGTTVQTILVTDDTNRTELREAAKLASRGDGGVVVFLTPSVLYESRATDAEEAYRRYLDFESFRRELASIPRVTAFEVGPTDSVASVLVASRQRRRAEQ